MVFVNIDGKVKVAWLTACANIAAPTTTELNAGTALESSLTPDGLQLGGSMGSTDTSVAGSTWSTGRAGRRGVKPSLKLHRSTGTDAIFNALTYGTLGYLVVRRGTACTTAWASNDKVAVYPCEVGEPFEEDIKDGGGWDYSVQLTLTGEPNQRAVVA